MALASRDRRDWALCRAKVVSQSETILASHEADSRDLASQKAELDSLIQTALAKTILDLRGAFLPSCKANVVSVETILDSQGVFTLARGCDWFVESLICLSRDLLSSSSQRGSSYTDLPMLARTQGTCATPREKLFKPFLVMVNDQGLYSRPNVTLQHLILSSRETIPQRSRHLFFSLNCKGGKLTKIEETITSN